MVIKLLSLKPKSSLLRSVLGGWPANHVCALPSRSVRLCPQEPRKDAGRQGKQVGTCSSLLFLSITPAGALHHVKLSLLWPFKS